MNTVRLERQVQDWWLLTGGYFYSRLEGDASFDQTTTDPSGNYASGSFWHGDDIILKRETHMGSVSSLFVPMEGLSASLAAQVEWTHQKGAGTAFLDPVLPRNTNFFGPSIVDSDLDKTKYSGNAGIRFTKIPWTALFAEARLEREDIGLSQDEIGDQLYPFKRSTDSTNDRRDVRAGFDTSPWHWASLTAHYRSGVSDTDYDHTKLQSYEGYPGFIRHRNIDSDEALVKLVLHPTTWLKTALTYRLVSTHYSTGTDAATDSGALVAPGGEILAGRYKAHEYGLNLTLTPYQRLYFSGAFTYSDSRTETAQNGISAVVPYKGDVYSLSASASYVLNKSTDLHATYSFSRADYGQNNEAGLPLGLNYTRHGLMVGVTRRLTSSLTANLRYGFFQYSEPSSGAVNDYTAHGVFATLVVKWP